jgi:hypothetical protein
MNGLLGLNQGEGNQGCSATRMVFLSWVDCALAAGIIAAFAAWPSLISFTPAPRPIFQPAPGNYNQAEIILTNVSLP